MAESWIDALQSAIVFCSDRLVSDEQVNERIHTIVSHADSPVDAVQLIFERESPFSAIVLGQQGIGDPSEITTVDPTDKYGSSCRIEVWKKRRLQTIGVGVETLMLRLQSLVNAIWKSELRNEKSWIVSPDRSESGFVDKTIEGLLTDSGLVARFFLDLDHFKAVNETFDHDVGDRVIREFAAVLCDVVSPSGIVFHRSGDEFAILYPGRNVVEILDLARRATSAVSEHDFEVGDLKVTAKVGITLVDRNAYEGALPLGKSAELAAKMGWDGEPNRGKTRLFALAWPTYLHERVHLAKARDIALCVMKGGAPLDEPFCSPWLNVISSCVHDAATTRGIEAASDVTRSVLAWIKPQLSDELLVAAYQGKSVAAVFSNLDVAFAVSHGLMRATLDREASISLKVLHSADYASGQLTVNGDICIYAWGQVQGTWEVLDLGESFHVSGSGTVHGRLSRAILLRIGDDLFGVPADIFSSVIVVDDRPTGGGGLPDFWEAAIARLVASVQVNPNVSDIFIIGDKERGKQTIAKLESIDRWPEQARRLAYKTGMGQEDIIDASTRLSGHVKFPATDVELAQQCAELFRPARTFTSSLVSQSGHGRMKFLTFELGNKGFTLTRDDGCRVETIARAYPLVLEIVRKATAGGKIVDEAGQELQELIDFKVSLTNPLQDKVPSFYDADRHSLSEYFEREFISSDGLFQNALAMNGQLDAVIEHVVDVIRKDRPFNTRRAVLVIPHIPEHGRDLHPLGLISVRITPRFDGSRTILHFTFSWRTVEALVGFPYSLYGSVCFSEHLTRLIAANFEDERQLAVTLGEVHYIAHSLHFFLDKYGQNIAHRIIDEASF